MARKVGYWWSEHEPELPKPVERITPRPHLKKFLRNLQRMQLSARERTYKGWSKCRICEIGLGSHEYNNGDWRWPGGLIHYITEHNVRLPKSFVKYVLDYKKGK